MGDDAKCPMGFTEGPNPHEALSAVKKATTQGADDSNPPPIEDGDKQKQEKSTTGSPPSEPETGSSEEQPVQAKGGRCPWPFVFFHDAATGMKDWQTWVVIGLALCWCWSRVQ